MARPGGDEDAAAGPLLAAFGIGPEALIGAGGQSLVYALDSARILRVYRRPGDPAVLRRLGTFLATIDGQIAFPTPRIERIDPEGRFTIERRLAGRALIRLMPELRGDRRRTALERYARAAEAVAAVTFPDRPFGQVLAAGPMTAPTWRGYLGCALDGFVTRNGATIAAAVGDADGLAGRARVLLDAVPEPAARFLVHGDFFPGNVLLDDRLTVSGLVDFSSWTVIGDPVLDIAGAALFLEMVAEATAADIAFVRDLVFARHGPAIRPAARFYRAYAAFAVADPDIAGSLYPRMFPWALETLRALRDGTLEA